jgi:hypothetical protein
MFKELAALEIPKSIPSIQRIVINRATAKNPKPKAGLRPATLFLWRV